MNKVKKSFKKRNMKKVFIHSLPRKTATGISEFTDETSGKNMNKTKFGSCKDGFEALYSSKVGGRATGLYKPWMENGVQVTDKNGTPLTLQDKYEQQYNKPKGFLHNKVASFFDAVDEDKLSYFDTLRVKLNDGSTVLDLDDFDDLMRYHIVLESKFVANSLREHQQHKWPHATHYIALENEDEAIKYKRNQIRSKAFSKLHDADTTDVVKRKIVSILDLASSKANISIEAVDNLLFEYINSSDFNPSSNIDKFMEVIELIKSPKGKEEFEARFFLKELIDNRSVYEKQGAYTWIRPKGSITIGERYSEAIDFILNPKKDTLIAEMKDELKAKKI